MKKQILEIIENYPKHFSQKIKKNTDLYAWVKNNSLITSHNLAENIYSALHATDGKCSNNKQKKFKSITSGYGFCGPASVCVCATKSVSEKVSKAKSLYSLEQTQIINARRKSTTLKKYGVTNNGQTEIARNKHKKYYETVVRKPHPEKTTTYQRLNKKYKSIANVEFYTTESKYNGVSNQTYYQFKCLVCDNVFEDYVDNGHVPKCKICNPYTPTYTSKQEIELFEYVKSLVSCEVRQSDKSIINPYEIDIVVPALNVAIEYCGLYWHSEVHKSDKNYHMNKLQLCANKGYRLITIFEDEWLQKSDIVKSRLKSILKTDDRIYARKCRVTQISTQEATEFIKRTHIQGSAVFKVAYGCFYNDNLVAVMTFGKPRYDKTADYELIRFCSKHTIVGAASKLFSAFLKDYKPESVISYCDMRWGTGNLYKKLNFVLTDKKLTPSYSYTDFRNRYHRSKFTKKQIAESDEDKRKTEHQIMKEKNMYRIWDCGQTKWVYTNQH